MTPSEIAAKVKTVDQLWKILGVLNPMDRRQSLILEELDTTGKAGLVREYKKTWNKTFDS